VQRIVEARGERRERQVEVTHEVLLKLMDRVSSLDDDRILRAFIGAIEATLRTGYYQKKNDGLPAHTISLKFDSAKVPDLPKPRPYARSSSTARAWRACTCASGRSRAAACAGRIAARISAPRCWAWSRRRWSRTR
jgi:NAD-specific glutamate dehydrogenase